MAFIPPVLVTSFKPHTNSLPSIASSVPRVVAFGSSAKQAFKDYVKLNSSGADIRSHLGITPSSPRPTSALNSVLKLPGGSSSALRLPSSGFPGDSGGGYASSEASVASPALDYYKAALASHYGMDASTAYQEALANTSYQRSVQDMLNAGLNPASLFAAGRVSGADGVGYATQLGSGFVGSGSSGGGSARSKYIFSKGLYNALSVVGGGIAVAASKNPFAYPVGATAAKGIMQAVNGLFG